MQKTVIFIVIAICAVLVFFAQTWHDVQIHKYNKEAEIDIARAFIVPQMRATPPTPVKPQSEPVKRPGFDLRYPKVKV